MNVIYISFFSNLALRGFCYANAHTNRDGSVSWRCTKRFCRAQIKVVDGHTEILGSHNHDSDPKILMVSKQILLSTVQPEKNLESPTSAELTTQTVTSSPNNSKFLPTLLQGTISVYNVVCSKH